MTKYKYIRYRGKRVKISKGGWDGKNKKGQKRRLIKGKLIVWTNYLKKHKKRIIGGGGRNVFGLDKIKKEMLDKFDFWAYNNLKGYIGSRHKIISNLDVEEVSDEGEDVYQLTDASYSGFPIKLRYDKRNSILEVYLRGVKYAN